jgi:uncharacterized protein YndB with AHSA1/START domain
VTALESRHIAVFIARAPDEVYAYASDPRHLPRWAAGLARSEAVQEGGEWFVESPLGKVRVRFAETDAFGVLDHDVALDSGAVFHNPMRVLPNGDGSEVVFTLIRHPGMPAERFAEDQKAVAKDLATLKGLLETPRAP